MPQPVARGHAGATRTASVAMGSPGSAGASGDTRTVEAPCPGAPASTTTCGPGDMPAVVKVAVAPVTSGWWSTSVAVAATCSWYVTPASSVAPGRTTKRLASRELRTTRVPGTGGFNVIAASVAAMFMAVEKLTEIEASTATPVDPSAGTSARITGAGPVVIVQWWSTEFSTPLGSVIPAARVNVYEVLGAKIARGWSSVKPVSPENQTIRHGASGPALNAVTRLHEGIARFTEKRPRTEDVTTGLSNSTVTAASAA